VPVTDISDGVKVFTCNANDDGSEGKLTDAKSYGDDAFENHFGYRYYRSERCLVCREMTGVEEYVFGRATISGKWCLFVVERF